MGLWKIPLILISSKAVDFEVKVAILKKIKNQLLKAVRKASNRAEAVKKKFQDVEVALMKSVEENV